VLAADGSGFMSDVVAAIYWAADQQDVDVISMSIGVSESWKKRNCDSAYPDLDAAVDYAFSKGKVVVAAAGNNPAGVDAPACLKNAIAVGAVDSNNAIASFSSQGLAMLNHGLVAPGVGIYSTRLYGAYAYGSGTSYSAPQVSGVIALMKQKKPKMKPGRVRRILFKTAIDLGASGADKVFGHGLVDAFAAVQAS
jgi:subtilisin family serine protease